MIRSAKAVVAVVVTCLGGLALASPAAAAVPTLTSFTPTSGPMGTVVSVRGSNFTAPATVRFNGVATTGTVASTTSLTATVPAAASTGKISVTTPGGTATSTGTFTVTPGADVTPGVIAPGGVGTLALSGFGAGEAVDIYVDSTEVRLAVTDAAGRLDTALTIPATSVPGEHTVTAVGRRSGSAGQATFKVRTDWLQRGYDVASTGTNPFENVLSPTTVPKVTRQWRVSLGNTAITSTPAVAAGIAYASFSDGSVRAYRVNTGALVWNRPLGASGNNYSSPAVVGGVVYVGVANKVFGLTAATGAVKWTLTTGGNVESSPRVVSGVVYVGSDDHNVYALDATSGRVKWTHSLGDVVFATPTVVDGQVFVGAFNGELFALDAATGSQIWGRDILEDAALFASPVVSDGLVYQAGSNVLKALRVTDGMPEWTAPLPASAEATPALDDGVLYIGDNGGTVTALDAGDGSVRWARALPNSLALQGPMVAADGVVYAGAGTTYALSESSGARLRTLPAGAFRAGLVVNDGALILGDNGPGGLDDALVRFALPAGAAPPAARRPVPSSLHPTLTRVSR